MKEIMTGIVTARSAIEAVKRPRGTRDNPALSCRDLRSTHVNFTDGYYWIDARGGGAGGRPLRVYCKGQNTCVFPDNAEQVVYTAGTNTQKFSQLYSGYRVSYEGEGSGAVQLRFLRLLSNGAKQNFTYTCIDAKAIQRADIPPEVTRLNNVKLFGYNSAEFKEPILLKDECKEGFGEIVLEIKTSRSERLPITDFQPLSFVDAEHQFTFNVGPVCFT